MRHTDLNETIILHFVRVDSRSHLEIDWQAPRVVILTHASAIMTSLCVDFNIMVNVALKVAQLPGDPTLGGTASLSIR